MVCAARARVCVCVLCVCAVCVCARDVCVCALRDFDALAFANRWRRGEIFAEIATPLSAYTVMEIAITDIEAA